MKRIDNVELRTSYESPKITLQFEVSDVILTSADVETEEKGSGFELDGSNWC